MQVKDLVFKTCISGTEEGGDRLYSAYTELGRITILNRLTGWGDGDVRDTETGYKDTHNEFWLASGGFDIRDFPELTVEEAVVFIKKSATVCVGKEVEGV